MTQEEEYVAMANAMSEETKRTFDEGADAILEALKQDDVRYGLGATYVIALSELGVLLKVLPMFADREADDETRRNEKDA